MLTLRFLSRVALWTAGFLGLVLLATWLSGERDEILTLHATRWLAGMIAFAAFPAGIGIARDVITWRRPRLARMAELTLAASALALLVVGVRGYLGPLAVRAAYPDREFHAEVEPAALLLHERPAALRRADARASADPDAGVAEWLPANRIAWELDVTFTGAALAVVLAWIGVLVGSWSDWTPRKELQRAQYWLVGLFLLVSGYGMTENTYELIVLNMAGPAYFGPWFALLVPSMVLLGMAFPTASRLLVPNTDATEDA